MQNVLFVHNRNSRSFRQAGGKWIETIDGRGGATIAMEELQAWFFEDLKLFDFFDKKIGKARCSEEDNFSKKAGRDLALSRMKIKTLTVVDVDNQEKSKTVTLRDKEGSLYLLLKYKNAKSVFFIGYASS